MITFKVLAKEIGALTLGSTVTSWVLRTYSSRYHVAWCKLSNLCCHCPHLQSEDNDAYLKGYFCR